METPSSLYKRFNNYLDEPQYIYDEWDDDEEEYSDLEDEEDEWTEEDEREAMEAGKELFFAFAGGCLLFLVILIVFPLMVVAQCVKLNKN